ncbi:MAG: heparan-alpha-glucosaminide N-acetyltransferase [Spirochaetota bacterium]
MNGASGREGSSDRSDRPGAMRPTAMRPTAMRPAAVRQATGRSLVLDAIRGILVILMVIYHAAYISVMSGLLDFELYTGFWWIFPRTIAAGFMTVSGWSLAGKKARGSGFRSFLVRAGRLAVPALAITVISAFMFHKGFVFFGILQLLAASSILAWPFLGRPVLALAAGLTVMAGGLMLGGQRFDWPYLAWLGLRPSGLYPVDYLPILPWFAWCLFGAAAGDLVIRHGLVRVDGTSWQAVILGPLAYAGRHSLTIYLVHLPALYGLGSLLALLTRS